MNFMGVLDNRNLTILLAVIVCTSVYPVWRILRRANWSRSGSFLALIPLVNIGMLWAFAFDRSTGHPHPPESRHDAAHKASGLRLGPRAMRRRLSDHVYTLYLGYAFFIKGAVVALAGTSIYSLLTQTSVPDRLDRILLWFVSFGFSCITAVAWSRGSVFTSWHANLWDAVLPLGSGAAEVMLYAVLAPSQLLISARWTDWYAVFAVFTAFLSGLILNRRHEAQNENFDHSAKMKRMLAEYRRWIVRDLVAGMALSATSAGLYAVSTYAPATMKPIHPICGVAGIAIAAYVLHASSKQYREIGQVLSE